MKIPPPLPPKKRNITFHYDINATLSDAGLPSFSVLGRQKKLRRLPHIFNRILELPFSSEADDLVQENQDCFRFALTTDQISEDVQTRLIEIVPGISKIVVGGRNLLELSLDELELDRWRFRLPPTTRPELARAEYTAGELVVIVPKTADFEDDNIFEEEQGNDPNIDDVSNGISRDEENHAETRKSEGHGPTNGSTDSRGHECKPNTGSSNSCSSVERLVIVQ